MKMLAIAAVAGALGCGSMPAPRAPLTQQRDLDTLEVAVAWPSAPPMLAIVAMGQFMAAHREAEGAAYFGRLAREQPARAAMFGALAAVMQVRLAGDVPLLKRMRWVEAAIGRLDAGAAADPVLGRLLRGLVFAQLPARFGKARTAIADLEAIFAHRDAFPIELDRGVLGALAAAYRTAGDAARADALLARAGLGSDGAGDGVLGDISIDAADGFRFSAPHLVADGDGVYTAEGFDFSNLSFLVGRDGAGREAVVAIDAGTTPRTARAAVEALRGVTRAPIKYVILTHAHWDHVGGLSALREPGTIVIAQAGFAAELAHSRDYAPPFHDFFGGDAIPLDAAPDRLIAGEEQLVDGDIALSLVPVHGGETDDALLVHDARRGVLFVGDAFMPYLGAPFVAEGSPQGYLDMMATVARLAPRRLIHGHSPLTRLFTIDALPGLARALADLHAHTLASARAARSLADALHDAYLPPSLRDAPVAVMPYLLVRDNFVQRTYRQAAGYWAADGDGMDHFTRAEWARALDELAGGGGPAPFARVALDLASRGDQTLALHIADVGLARYPASAELAAARAHVLRDLRQRTSGFDPFRFIIYSELAGTALPPVRVAP